MLLATLILEPLAQTTDGDTSSFSNIDIGVLKTSLDNGPHLVHERGHELAAAFHRYTKREHSTATVVGVCGTKVLEDEHAKGREDLGRRKSGRERIDDAESGLSQKG